MIFDSIRYGIFTADDFINAHGSNDFSKFTSLPIDLRKQFIIDAIDLHPSKESKKFKQAAFDALDGKITEFQFREAYWKYRMAVVVSVVAVAGVVAAVAAVVGVVGVARMASASAAVAEYYRSNLEKHASHLNKLIQDYDNLA